MLALDARFTFLAVLCCLSALPFASVNAAVISRNPLSPSSPFPNSGNGAGPSSHSQHVLPWSSRSRFHKVRSSNPIQRLADAVISRVKHGHHKRSHKTILIPTNHGKDYLISHKRRSADSTPQWISGHKNMTKSTNSSTASTQSDEGTPGAVRIQSRPNDASQGRIIGSLYLNNDNGTYILNASENNETILHMIDVGTTTRNPLDTSQKYNKLVNLAILAFQNDTSYCATYSSRPKESEPMTMEECDDSNTSSGDTSQTFTYNPTTNELRPIWSDGSNGTAQAASMSGDANNTPTGTSTASSAQSSSTGLNPRDDGNTQNVTLLWDPSSGKATTADISESPDDSQSDNSTSSAVTTTMTQTVTVFQTGSASTTSTSNSPSSTGLNVEVIGGGGGSPSSSSQSQSSSSSTSMGVMDVPNSSSTMTSSSFSSAPSQSINAAAIASSIAASASASMASVSASVSSASASAMASAADFSASASASTSASASSTASSDPSSNTFVAAVMGRAARVRPEAR